MCPEVATRRDVVLNVSGLLWEANPHVDAAAYRATLARLYDALVAQGRTVSLLAHVLESTACADNDLPAVHEFAQNPRPRRGDPAADLADRRPADAARAPTW